MRTRVTAIPLALLILSVTLSAQTLTTAPVPSQFATAHNIFLASASAPGYSDEKVTAAAMYTGLYQSLAASGRFSLVANPGDADLSMIITLRGGTAPNENNFVSLEIYDVKTHTLLWVLDEPIRVAGMEKTFVKNVQASVLLFIDDLNTLASGNLPGDVSPPKPKSAK